jgi:hypothetical protein
MGLGAFLIVASVVFGLFFVTWGRSNWADVICKIIFCAMTVWSVLNALVYFGWIWHQG